MNVHSVAWYAAFDEHGLGNARQRAVTSADAKSPPPGKTDKRAAILDAALSLFVERGYHGTAVPAVAERAGVGAGTIYRYFANKEALVNALYRHWKGELAARVLAVFSDELTTREEFHRLWTQMAGFVREQPLAYAFLELHHHGSYLDEESRQMESGLFNFALEYIARKQAVGDFCDVDPAVLWSLVEGAFIGLIRSSRRGRVALDARLVSAAEDACWEMARPRSD